MSVESGQKEKEFFEKVGLMFSFDNPIEKTSIVKKIFKLYAKFLKLLKSFFKKIAVSKKENEELSKVEWCSLDSCIALLKSKDMINK